MIFLEKKFGAFSTQKIEKILEISRIFSVSILNSPNFFPTKYTLIGELF